MAAPLPSFLNYSGYGRAVTPYENLFGAPPFNYRGDVGGIPQVPSPQATQKSAIGGNLATLPSLDELTRSITSASARGAAEPFNLNLPGYGGMLAQSSANIGSELAGVVPQDELALLGQYGAQFGQQTGSPGSPAQQTALLRALNLTQRGIKAQGEADLSRAIGRTPTGPQFDPASMLVTPAQQQEWQNYANLLNAAPIPAQAANANLAALQRAIGQGRDATSPAVAAPAAPIQPATAPTVPGWSGVGTPSGQPPPSVTNPMHWVWDDTLGAYYNTLSGDIADQPGGMPWGPDQNFNQIPENLISPYGQYDEQGNFIGYEGMEG